MLQLVWGNAVRDCDPDQRISVFPGADWALTQHWYQADIGPEEHLCLPLVTGMRTHSLALDAKAFEGVDRK